jgi:hypothetical protein
MMNRRTSLSLAAAALFATALPSLAEVHSPAPGTRERKAIMDGLRDWVREHHQVEVIFVVEELKVKDGHAWTLVVPQSRDGGSEFEAIGAVLKRGKGDDWRVAFVDPVMEYIVSDDMPEAAAREKANRLLLRTVPTVPRELLPAR